MILPQKATKRDTVYVVPSKCSFWTWKSRILLKFVGLLYWKIQEQCSILQLMYFAPPPGVTTHTIGGCSPGFVYIYIYIYNRWNSQDLTSLLPRVEIARVYCNQRILARTMALVLIESWWVVLPMWEVNIIQGESSRHNDSIYIVPVFLSPDLPNHAYRWISRPYCRKSTAVRLIIKLVLEWPHVIVIHHSS